MRSVIVAACLIGFVPIAGYAAPPINKGEPKTLLEKIQGSWARKNHRYSFVINGKKWTEFTENKPGAPNATGEIEILPNKEYAIVRANNGAVLWLFPSGENVLAVETFTKGGVIWEDGRVFYRPGFEQ